MKSVKFGGFFGKKFQAPVVTVERGHKRYFVYVPSWKISVFDKGENLLLVTKIITIAGGENVVNYTTPYVFFTAEYADAKRIGESLAKILRKGLCSSVQPSTPRFYTQKVNEYKAKSAE
ncbi:hypothetical protein ACFLQI_02335 [Candidatus Undinarchaeota archaeon]